MRPDTRTRDGGAVGNYLRSIIELMYTAIPEIEAAAGYQSVDPRDGPGWNAGQPPARTPTGTLGRAVPNL